MHLALSMISLARQGSTSLGDFCLIPVNLSSRDSYAITALTGLDPPASAPILKLCQLAAGQESSFLLLPW